MLFCPKIELFSSIFVESCFFPMDPDTEVEVEFFPFARIYKSGRVERILGTAIVPASVDTTTGVASKDINIDPTTGVSARLYLPTVNDPQTKKLPILVYYHGGAFIIESASSPTYHNYLNPLAAKAGLLIVSVDYRRAPEYPLPAAHDDSWVALKWVVSHSTGGGESWLAEYGDFDKIFFAGDSAGANLAHHMAVRASAEGVKVSGLAMVHPYFTGVNKSAREAELISRILFGGSAGNEELLLYQTAELKGMGCQRVVVFVAEKDGLRERGRGYYEGLVGSGWGGEAELVEEAGEGHVFHLIKPECEKAVEMMKKLVSFLVH